VGEDELRQSIMQNSFGGSVSPNTSLEENDFDSESESESNEYIEAPQSYNKYSRGKY